MRTFTVIGLLSFAVVLFAQSGSQNRQSAVMDANRVHTVFGNWGVIGQPGDAVSRGAWPTSTNGYLGDFSILIGTRIDSDSLVFASVETCPVNRPSLGGFDQDFHTGELYAFEPLPLGPQNLALSNDPATGASGLLPPRPPWRAILKWMTIMMRNSIIRRIIPAASASNRMPWIPRATVWA